MDNGRTTIICAIISGVVAIAVAFITSGAAFDRKLEAEQAKVVKLEQDLASASSQTIALQSDLATLRSQLPKSFRPSQGNCKPPSQTPGVQGEPNVCGGDYFMTGLNHAGKCCLLHN
jgi:hypothetical protein